MREEKSLMNMIKTAFLPMMIYYFVHQISAILLLSFVSGIPVNQGGMESGLLTILAKMLAMIIGGMAVCFYYLKEKRLQEDRKERKNKSRFNIPNAILVAVTGAVFSLGLNYLFAITGLTESSASYSQVAKEQFSYALVPALLFYGVVSPMVEELVFRGVVYNSLRRNLGIAPAILGSALLFGAIHGNIVQMLYGTIMGVVMAVLYEKYGNLSASIIFHGAANAAIYLCTYLF